MPGRLLQTDSGATIPARVHPVRRSAGSFAGPGNDPAVCMNMSGRDCSSKIEYERQIFFPEINIHEAAKTRENENTAPFLLLTVFT